jgi:glycolate oxidase iron-sulfur subunit
MALIKAIRDGRLAVSDRYRSRLASCTGCLACEESCASGVPVSAILQAAKEQAAEEAGTGTVNAVIAGIIKHPAAFRLVARLAPMALHFSGRAIKGRGSSLESGVQSSRFNVQRLRTAENKRRKAKGTIIFFPGCAITYFQPDIGTAMNTVLNALGYDMVVPSGLNCCGRPLLSLGDRKSAVELAAHNSRIFAELEADAIVTACASCGLTFKKEYPKLLPPGSKRPVVLDIHEFLASKPRKLRLRPVQQSITIHDPCHLGRGQGLSGAARDLLAGVPGITILEMQNADRCCGFGGVMRVTQRGLSDGIAEEKVKSIIATGASITATGCPGCRMQLTDALRRAGSDVTVLHPVQILEAAISKEE